LALISPRLDTALGIVHVSSEVSPYSSTGGLGNVVGSLSNEQARAGHRVSVISPRYRSVRMDGFTRLDAAIEVPIGEGSVTSGVWTKASADSATLYLLDIPELYDRDGLYGADNGIFVDNFARFTALSRGALETVLALELDADILHLHDWHAALVPVYAKSLYAPSAALRDSRSVLTIHNLAYQGRFSLADAWLTGLPDHLFHAGLLEYFGDINCLKGGILAADAVTAVSPRYAEEIRTPEFGCGIDGELRARAGDLTGIINGIDTETWDPATDPHLAQPFSADDPGGKAVNKTALRDELALVDDSAPLIGIVSRLADQKGIDLAAAAIPSLVESGAQWAILGTGEPDVEASLLALQRELPDRVAVRIDFDTRLAHRIFAAADFMLMPSRFEPCGLNQMYSLRYGAIPIVSAVGGHLDTVRDVGDDARVGTGILMDALTLQGIAVAVRRGLALYASDVWDDLSVRAMREDFSWSHSVDAYVTLYREYLDRPAVPLP